MTAAIPKSRWAAVGRDFDDVELLAAAIRGERGRHAFVAQASQKGGTRRAAVWRDLDHAELLSAAV